MSHATITDMDTESTYLLFHISEWDLIYFSIHSTQIRKIH